MEKHTPGVAYVQKHAFVPRCWGDTGVLQGQWAVLTPPGPCVAVAGLQCLWCTSRGIQHGTVTQCRTVAFTLLMSTSSFSCSRGWDCSREAPASPLQHSHFLQPAMGAPRWLHCSCSPSPSVPILQAQSSSVHCPLEQLPWASDETTPGTLGRGRPINMWPDVVVPACNHSYSTTYKPS